MGRCMGRIKVHIQKPRGLHVLHCADGLIRRVRSGIGRGHGHLPVDYLLPRVIVRHRATQRACEVPKAALVWARGPQRVVGQVPLAYGAGVITWECFRQNYFAEVQRGSGGQNGKANARSEAVAASEYLRTCGGTGRIREGVAKQNPLGGQLIDVRSAGRVRRFGVAADHVIAKVIPKNENDVGHHLAPWGLTRKALGQGGRTATQGQQHRGGKV